MEIREMNVERRQGIGKGQVKKLRRSGIVPAILYGSGTEPLPLAIAPRELRRVLGAHAGGGVLVNLRFPGDRGEARTAIIRDLQYDPVSETLLHVDLQTVSMDKEITVEVSIHVVGEAAGVKEQKGVLAMVQRAVEVACLPALIPERLDVDVTGLRIGDVLTVADLRLPEGVRVLAEPTQALVTVSPPMAEEVAAPAAPTPAEPEVVTERKPEAEVEEEK